MLQKDLIAYFSNRMSEFSSLVKINGVAKNQEAVHDLRVNIKKIRTVIRTFNLQKKNRKIRKILKKNIGDIFKKAGKLRDMQVQCALVKDYEQILGKEFFDLKEYISIKLKLRQKSIRKLLPGDPVVFYNPFISLVNAGIEALDEEKIKNFIVQFIDGRIKKFNKTKVRFYPKKLHKQRKILKELRFTYEMLTSLTSAPDFEDQVLRIKELEEILGRWNDYNLLKASILGHIRVLKKSDPGYVIKMNALSEAVSDDIVRLLDNYHKLIAGLNPVPVDFSKSL
ncbi:MAG: CHAD domain-containing protein [Bacteroidales bacterium]|nr:CHAD domain-containing protein [Bacteroidales bacterium]